MKWINHGGLLLPLVRRGLWMLPCAAKLGGRGSWNLHVMVPRMENSDQGDQGSAHGSRLAGSRGHRLRLCSCGWQPEWPTVDEVRCRSASLVILIILTSFLTIILHYPFHNYTPSPTLHTIAAALSLACATDDVVTHSFPFRHRQRRNGADWPDWQAAVEGKSGVCKGKQATRCQASRLCWAVDLAGVTCSCACRARGAADKGSHH